MMVPMTNLKPCPFCGSEPSGFPKDAPETVNCLSCVIRSYIVFDLENGKQHGLKPDDWNARVTGWRDIASAPKPLKARKIDLSIERPDGTVYRVIDAWWGGEAGWVVTSYFGARMKAPERVSHKITHWMHRPDKPEAA